jgi:gliding motility-associated-like protein
VKKRLSVFIVCILTGTFIHAQEIDFSVFIRHSDCNGANNGKSEINILPPENPPYTYLWSSGDTNHIVTGLSPGNYSVTVTDSAGNDTLINITINEIPCLIAADDAFTPNSDGYNDTWSISEIENYPDNRILVYNRWGQKVFDSKGMYKPWDGRDLFGASLPDNSYFYVIYGDSKDESSIVKGTVSIIR